MISYRKLWRLLVSRGMNVSVLYTQSVVSGSTFTRLRNDNHVGTYTLCKICEFLNCQLSDIAEYVEDD